MRDYLFSEYGQGLPKDIAKYLSESLNERISHENIIPCSEGCNTFGYEINKDYIVRFALNEKSLDKLKKEKKVLDYLEGKISIQIPKTEIFSGKHPFSIHRKILGGNLLEEDFLKLSNLEKDKLAYDLSLFFSEMHSIPIKNLKHLELSYWDRYERVFPNKEIIVNTIRKTNELGLIVKNFILEFVEVYFDNEGNKKNVFGHFDVMSKNLAFDLKKNKLNGIFDFGDCGIGGYLYDFSQIDFGLDLWKRMKRDYERFSQNEFDIKQIQQHSLFAALGFYVNYLNGIEKVQTDCLEKLIRKINN